MLSHLEMDDMYELYVLGVLEPEFTADIDQHVADNCETCLPRIREALTLTAALAGTAPSEKPSAALRDRVLNSVLPDRKRAVVPVAPPRRPSATWGAIWGLSAACAALLFGCIWLGSQNGDMRARLAAANRERNELEAALKTLSRSETRTVQFGKADQPHGRVFVNRGTGVVFSASSLPKLASNRTFQLWLIPPSGAPKSAGLFRADVNDESVHVSTDAVDPGTKAVAVSVEPESGSPAPTTTPIIVVPLAP